MTEGIHKKIRALLALAKDSAATPAEAQVAMSKAFELMRKHDLEEQDILGSEKMDPKNVVSKIIIDRRVSNLSTWETFLIAACRGITGTELITYRGRHITQKIFGLPDDVESCILIFEWLKNQMERFRKEGGHLSNTARRCFREGFALEVFERANKDVQSLKENGGESALIFVGKEAVVKKGIELICGPTKEKQQRRSRGYSDFDHDAYDQGREAGSRASMSSRKAIS